MDSETNIPSGCQACPHATDRRAFLRHMALAVAGTLAVTGLSPGTAFASGARYITPLAGGGNQRRYDLPRADGVSIDSSNEVIIARWQGHVYAFSLRCPHRGTKLVWHADESRVFCPKHKARFRPDGAYDSGRRTRALDRYAVRRQGAQLVVDLAAVLREDADALRWATAAVTVA